MWRRSQDRWHGRGNVRPSLPVFPVPAASLVVGVDSQKLLRHAGVLLGDIGLNVTIQPQGMDLHFFLERDLNSS